MCSIILMIPTFYGNDFTASPPHILHEQSFRDKMMYRVQKFILVKKVFCFSLLV